jgi:hypothetical protein
MGSACRTYVAEGESYGFLMGQQEGKRPAGNLRRVWIDIKLALGETELAGMDWIAQVEASCEHCNKPF